MKRTGKQLNQRTKIGDVVHVAVYDCFEGEVKLLRKKKHKYYVKILSSTKCYRTQRDIPDGTKMWIPQRLICEIAPMSFADKFRQLFIKTKY